MTSNTSSQLNTNQPISQSLSDNRQELDKLLANCYDIMMQPYQYGSTYQYQALSVHCDTLADEKKVLFIKSAFRDLASQESGEVLSVIAPENVIRFFENQGVSSKRGYVQAVSIDKAGESNLKLTTLFFRPAGGAADRSKADNNPLPVRSRLKPKRTRFSKPSGTSPSIPDAKPNGIICGLSS
ncbi:hypothetical protein ACFPYJ_26055 [Paenibacillus solisilvae]|uniref:Uncharacterized protein n=1 Tax=Paenibacillus solisilvae TaxID=2486751 RepID=A0ABW0W3V3_9BACL